MTASSARFHIGQLIHHRLFDYRGVIIDVDADFQGSDDWYEQVARSRPPKDQPWYHVLIHELGYQSYVAERNLEDDPSGTAIDHPDVSDYFTGLAGGRYLPHRRGN